MPVELTIVETTLELGQTNVEVILESASEPGPAGPGVPAGGTINQVLTKDSATDFDTSWQDAQGGGGGAPDDADYLVGTAHGDLSAEIVVGTTPGGELGGTWAAPTVDATHSGSSHAAVQAAAEATAAAALSAHEADTTGVHGIADTSALALTANHPSNATFNDHSARHEDGGADEISLTGLSGTPAALTTHEADTTSVHGIADTSALALTANHPTNATFNDHSARHEDGGADEISIQGLAGTPLELTNHLSDAADAHDASAISVLDSGANYTATDVEGVLAEIAPQLGGGVPDLQWETRSTNTILGVADKGKAIDITATITQTFEADETLGDGWWVIVRNATDDGTEVVTLDPAGIETINGLTTVVMYSGETRIIYCNGAGANFNSVLLEGGFALFTANGNFIVPHGATEFKINPVGGGGGGGGGRGGNAGTVRQGGGGGGGGAAPLVHFEAGDLGDPGDSITVTIGAGGAGAAGGSAGNGSIGSQGGSTTFGSLVTAFGGGGGGGGGGTANDGVSGGGGGGVSVAGGAGAINADSTGGGATGAGLLSQGYEGAGCDVGSPNFGTGRGAVFGGASGGGATGDGSGNSPAGGASYHGGGGGGGGGSLPTGNTERTGGAGGRTRRYTAGGGGTAGAVDGGAGGAGATRGAGGGGGGSQASGTGGVGGAGADGGGGGGGGGGGTTVGGAGGDGGDGECRVWYS